MRPGAGPDWRGEGVIGEGAWRDLLRRHGVRPDKGLGQSFLFDPGALEKVLRVAELGPDESVLEIGAGVGSLTRLLAARVDSLVTVELDHRLLPALREVVGGRENVRVVEGDILELPLDNLMGSGPYSVVANIPYQITSNLIRKLMEEVPSPEKVVLTIQAEVAQRITAEPGEMSLLALGVQLYGRPRTLGKIGSGAFHPSPEVDSAILRIDRHRRPLVAPERIDLFFELARAAFEQRRKQLANSLAHGLGLNKALVERRLRNVDIDPRRRPQSLAISEWGRLAGEFADERE